MVFLPRMEQKLTLCLRMRVIEAIADRQGYEINKFYDDLKALKAKKRDRIPGCMFQRGFEEQ